MKQRIIALVLVIVMSLLALTSCQGSFNFAEEDLNNYVEKFDVAAFLEALQKLEIEDGDFTTNDDIRDQKVKENVYDKVVEALLKAIYESDKKTEGTLGTDGDVLYFVYYAVDAKTGNVYHASNMSESSITASSTSAAHVINLGNVDEKNEFMKLLKENIAEGNLEDYVYNTLTATEIKEQAKKDLLAENADATTEEITVAQNAAIKVKEGQTIYVSYTRTHVETDAEGKETTITETAAYEKITLTAGNKFHDAILHEKAIANVGATVSFYNETTEKSATSIEITEGEGDEAIKYTYSKVNVLWLVEKEGQAIATFTYVPYTSTQNVTPDQLTSLGKQDLKDVELTYYVYPVYAVSAPAPAEITIADILFYLYGSKLTKTSFELFEEEYVNGEEKIADLIDDIAKIYGEKDEKFYAEGSDLKTLLDAVKAAKDAVKGDKATDDEQAVIDAANEALARAKNAKCKEVIAKIVEAKKGEDVLGTKLYEEYTEDIYHTLKEAYDSEIVEKVQAAVWKLIEESVVLNGTYPQAVVDEFYEVLYESYEHDFYTGDYSTSQSNYKKYGTFEAYLIATLKVKNASEIEGAIIKEAKEYIDPILKIFVVSKALAEDAKVKLPQYVQADIDSGVYEDDTDSIERAQNEAKYFIINDDYLKYYKKEVGNTYYRNLIDSYGEINIRAGIQFNKLMNYLTSADIVMTEEEGHDDHGHAEYMYTEKDAEGNVYISFRTVKYTIVVETADTETDTETETGTENQN